MTYRRRFDAQGDDSLAKLARWVRPGTTLLELGAAAGYFTQHLVSVGCTVDVVEIDREAAAEAARFARQTIVADLDGEAWLATLGARRYDAIVCADVLEHLRNGPALLRRLRPLLADRGELLLSVPNVAHSALIARLIDERFDYGGEGLLDPTHVRLYTWRSLAQALHDADFRVEDWDATTLAGYETEFRVSEQGLDAALRDALTRRPHAFVYQWLARAVPGTSGEQRVPGPTSAQASVPVRLLQAQDLSHLTLDHAATLPLDVGGARRALEWSIEPGTRTIRLLLADRPGVVEVHEFSLFADGAALWTYGGDPASLCSEFAVAIDGVRFALLADGAWIAPDVPAETVARAVRLRATLAWPGGIAETGDYGAFSVLAATLTRERAAFGARNDELIGMIEARDAQLADLRTEDERRKRALEVQERIIDTDSACAGGSSFRSSLLASRGATRAGDEPGCGSAMTRSSIDIIVPVYNAPDDARVCIESVLEHTRGDYALVLIDDGSPDVRVRELFDELAARRLPQVTLLANERNLGFTRTANRGMMRSRADVVLLNSDAIVTSGWLDALARCAASDPRIGTVTPFSNNAEICSYPHQCVNHPWPSGTDPEPTRSAIAEAALPCYPELPTGVGFCFYVRRALLDAVGPFDEAFGAGYGEENDFCMRARAAGFRNVLCDDAFVLHSGGRSFAGAKEQLGVRNTALLLERHPGYLDLVRDFIARDPLAPLREAARTAYDRRHGPQPAVLHVLHGGGGTEAYARSLIAAGRGAMRNVLAFVRDERWRIEEHRSDGSTHLCEFALRPDEPPAEYLRMIAATFGVGVVHAHNLSGDPERLTDALLGAGIAYGVTVHDLQMACPAITLQRADGSYCGGETDAERCASCLREHAAPLRHDVVRWRERHGELLARAAFVIAPSRWAADMLRRYYPAVRVDIVPHGLPARSEGQGGARQVVLMPDDGRATVAVLGAIGPDKGARRVERLAQLARERGAPVRFVIVGYLDRSPDAWQDKDATLTVAGRYEPHHLGALLDYYGARLVLFPSLGPETFAYTLSEAWRAGRAVLVPPIGALAERVAEHGAGWILGDDEWRDEERLLARIVTLLGEHRRRALDEACARAAALPLPSFATMTERTFAAYRAAAQRTRADLPPVDRLRVVEAYGYRRASPPAFVATDGPAAARPQAPLPPIARIALRARGSIVGRALARLVPSSARAALWARFKP